MRPTLYTFSGAPRGWRVLLGLAFKGIDADIETLSVSDKDHHTSSFLKLNPRATIPVLTFSNIVLRDSIAILAWLDRAYPNRPLFGRSTDEASVIWQISMECCDYLREGTHQILRQVFSSDGHVPDNGSAEHQTLKAGADLVHAECSYLEDLLSDGRTFLAGDSPSAADAIVFPEIRLMQRAVETKNPLMASVGFGYPPDLYPILASWKDRMNAMPEVAATLPDHWQEKTPLAKTA